MIYQEEMHLQPYIMRYKTSAVEEITPLDEIGSPRRLFTLTHNTYTSIDSAVTEPAHLGNYLRTVLLRIFAYFYGVASTDSGCIINHHQSKYHFGAHFTVFISIERKTHQHIVTIKKRCGDHNAIIGAYLWQKSLAPQPLRLQSTAPQILLLTHQVDY